MLAAYGLADELILENTQQKLHCETILRHMIGKRIVIKGRWGHEHVVAKIFVGRGAQRRCVRELAGYTRLLNCNIKLAPMLYVGRDSTDTAQIILFLYLERSHESDLLWYNTQAPVRINFFKKVLTILAQAHRNGCLLTDLHPNNFLLQHEQLYLLDTADVHYRPFLLMKTCIKNLGQLLAQLAIQYDNDVAIFFEYYLLSRNKKFKKSHWRYLLTCRDRFRQYREKKFLQKIYRHATHYSAYRYFHYCLFFCKAYEQIGWLQLIKNINQLMTEGEALKIGHRRTVVTVNIQGIELVIKRYQNVFLKQYLRQILFKNKGRASWEFSQLLAFYKISAVKPVALYEQRWGMIVGTVYFFSEKIAGVNLAVYLQTRSLATSELMQLAQQIYHLFSAMKILKISHGDFKATNFIVHEGRIYLSDFDGMRKHRSRLMLNRALDRDRRRFLRNWQGELLEIFDRALADFKYHYKG